MSNLINNSEVKEKVDTIWKNVFHLSNVALSQLKRYGFYCMQNDVPLRDVNVMLVQVRMFSSAIEVLIMSETKLGIRRDEMAMLLKTKCALASMDQLAMALQCNDSQTVEKTIFAIESCLAD